MTPSQMDITAIQCRFQTRQDCIFYLERLRWPEKPICPLCDSTQTTCCPKELRHHCNKCHKSFSVLVGTLFQRTHVPLHKWFWAIHLLAEDYRYDQISGRRLAKLICVNKITATHMKDA